MIENISAKEALDKLIKGNEIYIDSLTNLGDISMEKRVIEQDIDIHHMEEEDGLCVMGAIYHLEDGRVEFFDKMEMER